MLSAAAGACIVCI